MYKNAKIKINYKLTLSVLISTSLLSFLVCALFVLPSSPEDNHISTTRNVNFTFTPTWQEDGNITGNCSLWTNLSGWTKAIEFNGSREGIHAVSASITNGSTSWVNYTFSTDFKNIVWSIGCRNGTGANTILNFTANRTLTVDTTPPIVTINSPSPVDGYNTSNQYAIINFSSVDSFGFNTTCNITIDGVVNVSLINLSSSNPTRTYGIIGFLDGTHNWNITCKDSINNTNTTTTRAFKVDTIAPSLTLLNPTNNTNMTFDSRGIRILTSDSNTAIKTNKFTTSCGASGFLNSGNVIFYPFNDSSGSCSGTSNVTLTLNITDYVGNSNVSSFIFGVDNTPPTVTAVFPSVGASLTSPVRLNWTSQDDFVKTSYIGYYLDSNPLVELNYSAGGLGETASVFANNMTLSLTGGNHTIIFTANDTVGNWGNSSEISFVVKSQIPLSDWSSGLNSTLGTELSTPPIFRVKNDSGDYNNQSGNEWTNSTYEIILNVNSTGTPINITLTDLDGSSADWSKINLTYIKTNNTRAYNGIQNNWTSTVMHMVYVNDSINQFAKNTNSFYGTVIFPVNISLVDYFWWLEDETNLQSRTEINQCGSVFTAITDTPCWNYTSGGRTIVFVPHYSIVMAGNDSTPPTLTVNSPASSQTVSGFIPNISVSSDAVSCGKYKINLTDTTKSSADSNYSSSAGTLSGGICTWSEIRFKNGVYNITFNTTDALSNTNTASRVFTVSDTSAPNNGTSITSSASTTGATISVANVNESVNMTIHYGTTASASTGTVTYTSFSRNPSKAISLSTVTTSATYYYNVTLCDFNGNCNKTNGFTFTQTATTTPDSGGSSSSSGSSSVGYIASVNKELASKSKMWSEILAGTIIELSADKKDLAVTLLKIAVKNDVKRAELKIASLKENPAAYSAGEKTFQYLELTKSRITDSDADEIKIQFRVLKSWLSENNLKNEDIVLKRYKSSEWNELQTKVLKTDSTYVYFESITPGLSYFAIGAKESLVSEPNEVSTPDDTKEDTTETQKEPEQKEEIIEETKEKSGIGTTILIILLVLGLIGIIAFVSHKHSKK